MLSLVFLPFALLFREGAALLFFCLLHSCLERGLLPPVFLPVALLFCYSSRALHLCLRRFESECTGICVVVC